MNSLCVCNCGLPVARPGNKYINHHHARALLPLVKRKAELPQRIRQSIVDMLLVPGTTIRMAEHITGIDQNTVMKIARTLALPPCPCGKPSGHKGWCTFRLKFSKKRMEFLCNRWGKFISTTKPEVADLGRNPNQTRMETRQWNRGRKALAKTRGWLWNRPRHSQSQTAA